MLKETYQSIRTWLAFFMVALAVSGLTAFPLETELNLAFRLAPFLPNFLDIWVTRVYLGLKQTNAAYPFIAYGTDWLAFAHLLLAGLFLGPYRDPVRNIWVIQFGLVACALVFPLAFIAGTVRGIPFFWQLIDCSFGFFGFLTLWKVYRKVKHYQFLNTILS